jgi:hypothetical protein
VPTGSFWRARAQRNSQEFRNPNDSSIATFSTQVGIAPLVLDEFLTGERTLRSDVLDRLAADVGYELHRTQ